MKRYNSAIIIHNQLSNIITPAAMNLCEKDFMEALVKQVYHLERQIEKMEESGEDKNIDKG